MIEMFLFFFPFDFSQWHCMLPLINDAYVCKQGCRRSGKSGKSQ